jgi:hypothetical protein
MRAAVREPASMTPCPAGYSAEVTRQLRAGLGPDSLADAWYDHLQRGCRVCAPVLDAPLDPATVTCVQRLARTRRGEAQWYWATMETGA